MSENNFGVYFGSNLAKKTRFFLIFGKQNLRKIEVFSWSLT